MKSAKTTALYFLLLMCIVPSVCRTASAETSFLIDRIEAELTKDSAFTQKERKRYVEEFRQQLANYAHDTVRGKRGPGAEVLMRVVTEGSFESVPVEKTVEAAVAAYTAIRRGSPPDVVEDIALYGLSRRVAADRIETWARGYTDSVQQGVPPHIAEDLVYNAAERGWDIHTYKIFTRSLIRAAGSGYDMEDFEAYMLGNYIKGGKRAGRTANMALRYFRKIKKRNIEPELPEYHASFVPQKTSFPGAGQAGVEDGEEQRSLPGILRKLTASYRSFIGAPYVRGGHTRRGTDCSGFVYTVFAEAGIRLPRTSRKQWEAGQDVAYSDLRKGDLVFFRTSGRRISHVGIVDDPGEKVFVHASSSKGVTFSNLESRYYKARYAGARRVLAGKPADTGQAAASAARQTAHISTP